MLACPRLGVVLEVTREEEGGAETKKWILKCGGHRRRFGKYMYNISLDVLMFSFESILHAKSNSRI